MRVLQGRRSIRPVAKKRRGGAHIESGREFDVFLETPTDQLLARDRRAEDRGEIRRSGTESVARHTRLGGQWQTESVEYRARAKQILNGGPQAAVAPPFTRRYNADPTVCGHAAHCRRDGFCVAQASGEDRRPASGQ